MKAERQVVVAEARSWLPTPYHRRAAIKHVGCDCGSFPAAVYSATGMLPADAVNRTMEQAALLSDDWFMHATEGKYLDLVKRHLICVRHQFTWIKDLIEPGNLIMGAVFNDRHRNHAAIVTRWPLVMDCIFDGVREVDASVDPVWSHHEVAVYDPWAESTDAR